jgi:ABC-type Fe3+/spermidine/putrescine transport system ATPase subunit
LHADGAEVETPFGRLRCPRPDFPAQVGDAVWVMVRPEAVQVTRGDEGTSAENTFVARLVRATYLGEAMELVLRLSDAEIKALHFRPNGGLPDEVRLKVAADDLRLLPRHEATAMAD